MPSFSPGDRVAWDHAEATKHAEGSIIREEAIPPTAEIGEVVEVANDEGTHFTVKFADGEKTLTEDELVRVG
jgi:hypothetical protein